MRLVNAASADDTTHASFPGSSVGPVKCAKETPKEGPTVSYSPILGGLNVHVTDRSGTTSQCVYDSDGFTRTFRLEANSTFDIKVVPAVPLGIDHQVDTVTVGVVFHRLQPTVGER